MVIGQSRRPTRLRSSARVIRTSCSATTEPAESAQVRVQLHGQPSTEDEFPPVCFVCQQPTEELPLMPISPRSNFTGR